MIPDHCGFSMGSDFQSDRPLTMRTAIVTANWRGFFSSGKGQLLREVSLFERNVKAVVLGLPTIENMAKDLGVPLETHAWDYWNLRGYIDLALSGKLGDRSLHKAAEGKVVARVAELRAIPPITADDILAEEAAAAAWERHLRDRPEKRYEPIEERPPLPFGHQAWKPSDMVACWSTSHGPIHREQLCDAPPPREPAGERLVPRYPEPAESETPHQAPAAEELLVASEAADD
jgi:hypothetical protein